MKENNQSGEEESSFTSISLKSPTRKKLKMKKVEEEYMSYDELLNNEIFESE